MSGASNLRSRSILLVDTDFRTSRRLAALLGEDGFEVEVARDGSAAMARLLQTPRPGTLITELAMPLADGSAIARHGRALDSSLRVIVLTRHPNLLVPNSFGGDAPEVLTKPLDYSRLLELLNGSACASAEPAAGFAAYPRSPSPRS